MCPVGRIFRRNSEAPPCLQKLCPPLCRRGSWRASFLGLRPSTFDLLTFFRPPTLQLSTILVRLGRHSTTDSTGRTSIIVNVSKPQDDRTAEIPPGPPLQLAAS